MDQNLEIKIHSDIYTNRHAHALQQIIQPVPICFKIEHYNRDRRHTILTSISTSHEFRS